MEQVCEIRKELQRVSYQHIRKIMNIQKLCEHMVGKMVVEAEAYYGENVLIIMLDDGSHIEISGDDLSVYSEVPELDD
jgi:3-methyladenine DNA glycosylase Mpg